LYSAIYSFIAEDHQCNYNLLLDNITRQQSWWNSTLQPLSH